MICYVGLEIWVLFVYRVFDKIEILKADQKQLNVMEHYMAYCKCRLRKEGIDFFIEPDKALRASQILCLAADSILREVDEAESKLKELEMIIKVYILAN